MLALCCSFRRSSSSRVVSLFVGSFNSPAHLLNKHKQFSRTFMASSSTKFVFAGCQLLVGENKEENLSNARKAIDEASQKGAHIVSLPECFNCPYSNASFPVYAESIPDGPSTKMLSLAASSNKVYLIGGSFPEKDGDKLYNTSLVFDPEGNLIAKHRKIHLFDIDVPGKIRFKESETLSPGSTPTVFETKFGKIGLGICYDIRFAELALLYSQRGAKFLVYPGAFNMTTGPAHWELLQRSRALDNQLYVAAVSPARNPSSSYTAWGHSTVVNPWGEVISTTGHEPGIIYAEIDFSKLDEIRANIPITLQKRDDIYKVVDIVAEKQQK
eukprot:TRINITY_DN258_c0_g1_i1.p1 TRINITY_DN258_c0_g1~~TRINITY_DN258_c0_g1_i1.p1  ORF type:complete len:328 (-),score=61.66 TRINITY_DN258_c0_g1_i1:351-1334(-)